MEPTILFAPAELSTSLKQKHLHKAKSSDSKGESQANVSQARIDTHVGH
jgi:hypothetical protein